MDKEIFLDTSICIELIKKNPAIISIFSSIEHFQPIISSISVFELYLRKTNLEEVEEFLSNVEILSLDKIIAKKASEIYKECKKIGHIIDFRDILIAASCIIANSELVTLNKKDFMNIKDLKLLNL